MGANYHLPPLLDTEMQRESVRSNGHTFVWKVTFPLFLLRRYRQFLGAMR